MAQTQDLQRLVVSLEARIDKFDKAMAKASGLSTRTTAKIGRDFDRLDAKLSRFGGFSIGGLLAGASVTTLISNIDKIIRETAKLGDAADKVGLTAEQFQELGFAAKQSGSDVESMGAALQQFGKRVGEAAMGQGDLLKLFQANNIAIRDMNGNVRPLNELFLEFADLVKNAGSQSERLKIATLGAGKAGTELVSVLQLGSAGLKEFAIQAQATGNVIDEDLVKSAQEFDDRFAKFFDGATMRARSHMLNLVRAIDDAVAAMDRLGSKGPMGLPGAGSNALRGAPFIGDIIRGWDAITGTGGIDTEAVVRAQRGSGTDRFRRQWNPIPTKLPGGDSKPATKAEAKETVNLVKATNTAMDDFIATMDDAREATRGFFGDLISGLREGATLTEALGQAFSNLADKMINKLLDQAVEQLLGPSGTANTGILGQLLGVGPQLAGGAIGGGAIGGVGASGIVGPTAPIIPVTSSGATTLNAGAAGVLGAFSNIRRNNPGNIEAGSFASRFGGTDAGRFAQFPDIGSGFEAMRSLLLGYQKKGLGSVNSMIGRWSPQSDPTNQAGSTSNYAKYVAGQMGVGANDQLNLAADPAMTDKMMAAMTRFEHGLTKVTATATTAATGLETSLVPAIQQVIGAVGGVAGGPGAGLSSGILPLISGGLFGGGRADGGSVLAGHSYNVGEHGTETFMPTVPGVILPNAGGRGGSNDMAVSVFESPMFKVIVERIAAQGDVRTMKAVQRGYPSTAARFSKLGTTSK